jgi:crossover junction endodeoxyribonuclease RuvC
VATRTRDTTSLLASGCITTSRRQVEAIRLYELHHRLMEIFEQWHPELMAIEELFFSRNVSTAMAVGQARGVALLAAAEARVPVQSFTPSAVKLTVTGSGRADKRQVQTMIRTLLKLKAPPKSDDTADAIALALCGLYRPDWAR